MSDSGDECRCGRASDGAIPYDDLDKWDRRMMEMAAAVSKWSKDPSTKVGAVIASDQHLVIASGYNGFPRGVEDLPERYEHRETKYKFVVHAEANAILLGGSSVRGQTLYINPLFSCNECAKLVIQAGIKRVVAPKPAEDRWMSSYDIALAMYREAGVKVEFVELPKVSINVVSALPLKVAHGEGRTDITVGGK